jgi:DNA-binding transcriptional LysR family regulator
MARLADLDLNLLIALDALLRERSVTRAGAALGLSQPAMSHALARLRELLGDELLVRQVHDMVPTPRAEALAAPLREVLRDIEDLLGEPRAFDPGEADRELVLAMTDLGEITLLPALIARLRVGRRLRLRVRALAAEVPEPALASGDIDLAIGTFLAPPPAMRVSTLYREEFMSIARRGHPGLATAMTAAHFAALPHLLVASPGDGPGVVDAVLAAAGLRRDVVVRTPHFLSVAALVASSDLIATVPTRVADAACRREDVVAFAPPVEVPGFDVQMFWHPRRDRDPALRWLRDQVRDAIRAGPP